MNKVLAKIFSPQIIISVIIAVLIILLCVFIKKLKEKYKQSHKNTIGERETAIRISLAIVRFFVILLGALAILQVNGINVSGMMAGLGIASAIVGLALQDFLKDIIMGVNIISDHFFSMGECVEFNGKEGVIVGMTLRTTKIGDLDDYSITTVCNREISKIRRLGDRLDIDIPLSYSEKLPLVNETLAKVCKEISGLDDVTKCTYEGTQSFESSSINYRIRVFCEGKKRADVRRAANRVIQVCLSDAGISIPFNQLDVHCDRIN